VEKICAKPVSGNVPVGVPELIEMNVPIPQTEWFKEVKIPNIPGAQLLAEAYVW